MEEDPLAILLLAIVKRQLRGGKLRKTTANSIPRSESSFAIFLITGNEFLRVNRKAPADRCSSRGSREGLLLVGQGRRRLLVSPILFSVVVTMTVMVVVPIKLKPLANDAGAA